MKSAIQTYWPFLVCFIFSVFVSEIWYTVLHEWPVPYMTVAFLDIGQGDAIYIESPTHNRILVDGGPIHSLLPALSKVVPFYVRDIDTLIVTNPDVDHFAGFIDLLSLYHVNRVIESGTRTTTATYKRFSDQVNELHLSRVIGRRGLRLNIGNGVVLTILYPDRDVLSYASNNGSLVAKLTYGSTSVMLTGDAPSPVEEYVLAQDGTSTVASTLLKVGHHGSRTSASEPFALAVNPQFAIASAGKKNIYGHPHKETIDLFQKLHIPFLVTASLSTIIFHCTPARCTRQF